ncbi:hypothetical protein POVCU1_080380 [Plasmodium ovale curtisi]|uniref:Uncharacterized protein n=1 Tax=Plasmodium ovale curtisi TaxID=864141 RepID=A0A1A8XFQ3_PLAOA|nr:hypothetical protein POVCU1_080380 [Plasmodium ovale curtisi]
MLSAEGTHKKPVKIPVNAIYFNESGGLKERVKRFKRTSQEASKNKPGGLRNEPGGLRNEPGDNGYERL